MVETSELSANGPNLVPLGSESKDTVGTGNIWSGEGLEGKDGPFSTDSLRRLVAL